MESIQNIADESSDEEGFEIDESAIDAVVEEQDDEEEPEEPSISAEIEHELSTSSSSSGNRNSEETDSVDEFAQARKVPLSHHVINTPLLYKKNSMISIAQSTLENRFFCVYHII